MWRQGPRRVRCLLHYYLSNSIIRNAGATPRLDPATADCGQGVTLYTLADTGWAPYAAQAGYEFMGWSYTGLATNTIVDFQPGAVLAAGVPSGADGAPSVDGVTIDLYGVWQKIETPPEPSPAPAAAIDATAAISDDSPAEGAGATGPHEDEGAQAPSVGDNTQVLPPEEPAQANPAPSFDEPKVPDAEGSEAAEGQPDEGGLLPPPALEEEAVKE